MRASLLLALVVIVGVATAARPGPKPFRSLIHTEKESRFKLPRTDAVVVYGVVATIARDAIEATEMDSILPPAGRAAIDRVDFQRAAVIAVYATTASKGFSVEVKRISLARTSKGAQWCLTAAVRHPQRAVPLTGHEWVQAHVVSVSTRRTVPERWVLRDVSGKLLSASRGDPPGIDLPSPVTGIAKACPRR